VVKHVNITKRIRPVAHIVADNIQYMASMPIDNESTQDYFIKHITPYSKLFSRLSQRCSNKQIKISSTIIDVMVIEVTFGINSFAWRDSFLPCIYTKKTMKYFKFIEKEAGYDYRYFSINSIKYRQDCLSKFNSSKHKAKVIMYLRYIMNWLNTSTCNMKAMNSSININYFMDSFKAQLAQMAGGLFIYDKNDDDDCIRLYFYILTLNFAHLLYISNEGFIKKMIKQVIYDKKGIVAK
jgi:hypothetical protein